MIGLTGMRSSPLPLGITVGAQNQNTALLQHLGTVLGGLGVDVNDCTASGLVDPGTRLLCHFMALHSGNVTPLLWRYTTVYGAQALHHCMMRSRSIPHRSSPPAGPHACGPHLPAASRPPVPPPAPPLPAPTLPFGCIEPLRLLISLQSICETLTLGPPLL